jgi:3',5'-cyclic AMP phosphodiesterase CpdA
MPTILQLSDLHLGLTADQQQTLVAPMVSSIGRLKSSAIDVDLVAITGDLFESTNVTGAQAIETVTTLIAQIRAALGGNVPVVLQPGNHDRRKSGIIGPHDAHIFAALKAGLDSNTLVTGCSTPFLAELVPSSFHQLPFILACFDSTYLPKGLFSAGGIIRQDDLLQLAERMIDVDSNVPLVLLTHHHLIPTPLTDLSRVDVNTTSVLARWAAREILAGLLANADHEEVMMTALGAGTALSTLHAFERPVVVLHGHKHYPAIRALRGPNVDQGDVLLVSAGSSATTLAWNSSALPDVAHLWPSYNVLTLRDSGELQVDVVAFGPRKADRTADQDVHVIRPVLKAKQEHRRWNITPVDGAPVSAGPRLSSLVARAVIANNVQRGASRADLLWDVRVVSEPGATLSEYTHIEEGLPGAWLSEQRVGEAAISTASISKLPAKFEIPTDGTPVTYRVHAGLCTTRAEATAAFDEFTAFESVEFLNRYESACTELSVTGLREDEHPFGSSTDLTTGHERPARVVRDGDRYVLRAVPCATRTLLRIRWPLLQQS